MSFDLFLLRLPEHADIHAALSLLEGLETGTVEAKGKYDCHRLGEFLTSLEPRYEFFHKDYDEVARFEGITVQEARSRDDSVELNGEVDGESMAQFVIYDNRVEVHWYLGTSEEEMNGYVAALGAEAGYALVDPQSGTVLRFPKDQTQT